MRSRISGPIDNRTQSSCFLQVNGTGNLTYNSTTWAAITSVATWADIRVKGISRSSSDLTFLRGVCIPSQFRLLHMPLANT